MADSQPGIKGRVWYEGVNGERYCPWQTRVTARDADGCLVFKKEGSFTRKWGAKFAMRRYLKKARKALNQPKANREKELAEVFVEEPLPQATDADIRRTVKGLSSIEKDLNR